MKSELVVDVQASEITTAFVEDGRLAELNREPRDMSFAVGNIYYGRVKKLMPALNAAFVDIGHEKDAFLHYLDLGLQFNSLYDYTKQVVSNQKRLPQFAKSVNQPTVSKIGSIDDVLQVGQNILVQIAKEPINTKGPRLTAEISIAGRYLVLIPFQEKVMISGKIKGEAEKNRLRKLVNSIKPKGYGVIVRTVAANVQLEELQAEMNVLYKRWEDAIIKLQRSQPVSLISAEIGRTIGIIRDVFNTSFDHIYVNDAEMYKEITDYVELIAPEQKQIVKLYDDPQPIFDYFDITRQTKVGLGRTVSFKYGGYLVIEKTEALFVIDVNSGTRKVGEDQEENALNMNLAAADEIVHQLRLRDMGGIIVVDFIDMANAENRQKLHDYVRQLMAKDRAKHNVLPLSKFGLMQITRQRVRPAVDLQVEEVCPTCHGKGKIQSSFLFADHLEEIIPQMIAKYGKKIRLYVHPYVYAYISKGWLFSIKWHWRWRYGLSKVMENQSLGFLDYHFTDEKGNRLKVEEPEPTPKKLVFEEEKPATPVAPKPKPAPVVKESKPAQVVKETKPAQAAKDVRPAPVVKETKPTPVADETKPAEQPKTIGEIVEQPSATKPAEASQKPKRSRKKAVKPIAVTVEDTKILALLEEQKAETASKTPEVIAAQASTDEPKKKTRKSARSKKTSQEQSPEVKAVEQDKSYEVLIESDVQPAQEPAKAKTKAKAKKSAKKTDEQPSAETKPQAKSKTASRRRKKPAEQQESTVNQTNVK